MLLLFCDKAIIYLQFPTVERVNLPGVVGFYQKNVLSNSTEDKTEEQGEDMHGSVENGNVDEISGGVARMMDEGSDGERREDIEEEDGDGSQVVEDGEEGGSCGDEDEDGWITPDNLAQAHEEMGGVTEEEARGLAVACVTTDFAMQVNIDMRMTPTIFRRICSFILLFANTLNCTFCYGIILL